MENIKDFKHAWNRQNAVSDAERIDRATLLSMSSSVANKQKSVVMQYFWGSLTFHIIVYAFLTHILVLHRDDQGLLLACLAGWLMYLPFTLLLLRSYKRMAVLNPRGVEKVEASAGAPIRSYLLEQRALLSGFYRFKKGYELLLLPLSSALFVWIFFRLYLPGGMQGHPLSTLLLFLLVLAGCTAAVVAENRRNFRRPLKHYEQLLKDLDE